MSPSICLTLAARSSRPLIEWKGQSVDRGGRSLTDTTCLLIEEAVIRQEAAMALIGWSGSGGGEACRCVIFGGSRSGKRDVKGRCARQQCAAVAWNSEGVAGSAAGGRSVRGVGGVEGAGGGWMMVSGGEQAPHRGYF